MTDLVTGATGFVGSHLTRALLAKGRSVRVLVRAGSNQRILKDFPVDRVEGDITEPSSLSGALAGIDRVYHCAALVSDWGPWDDFRRTNVQGVENMLAAAMEARVGRFIHLSTTDVYGFPRLPCDEAAPFIYRGWPYGDTKIDGEKKVWQYCREHGLPVTVIRPANVYGVGSRSFVLEIGRLLKSRDMIHLGYRRHSAGLCSVQNLVSCLLLAGRSPRSLGQSYNVTDGTQLSWRQFVNMLARKAGLPKPRVILPRQLAYFTGWLLEQCHNPSFDSNRPLLTRMAVEIFTADQSFSIEKIRQELGFQPSGSAEDIMDEMAAWLAREGC